MRDRSKKRKKYIPHLQVKRLGKNWWILGDDEAGLMGPYSTRTEAMESRRGVMHFYRMEAKGEWWMTSEKPTRRNYNGTIE
jgi:hypothetical protein